LFWSVLTSSLWMSLLPCPLRKKYFTIIFCLIRSGPSKYSWHPLHPRSNADQKCSQHQPLWTDFLAEYKWSIQKLI
jgi:hypothetical protein